MLNSEDNNKTEDLISFFEEGNGYYRGFKDDDFITIIPDMCNDIDVLEVQFNQLDNGEFNNVLIEYIVSEDNIEVVDIVMRHVERYFDVIDDRGQVKYFGNKNKRYYWLRDSYDSNGNLTGFTITNIFKYACVCNMMMHAIISDLKSRGIGLYHLCPMKFKTNYGKNISCFMGTPRNSFCTDVERFRNMGLRYSERVYEMNLITMARRKITEYIKYADFNTLLKGCRIVRLDGVRNNRVNLTNTILFLDRNLSIMIDVTRLHEDYYTLNQFDYNKELFNFVVDKCYSNKIHNVDRMAHDYVAQMNTTISFNAPISNRKNGGLTYLRLSHEEILSIVEREGFIDSLINSFSSNDSCGFVLYSKKFTSVINVVRDGWSNRVIKYEDIIAQYEVQCCESGGEIKYKLRRLDENEVYATMNNLII